MIMPHYLKDILIAVTLLVFVSASCRNAADEPHPERQKSPALEIEIESLADNTQSTSPINDYFIDGRSIILISQRGDHMSIDFNDYDVSPDDPSELVPNTNLYKYVYYSNPEADWNKGFNFMPYGDYELNWTEIEKNPLNGEYSLGALYYPVGYEVYNSIQTDQTTAENLRRSNVLGAWHRTNTPHDRLRFRFYHLMAAVRVTLLIPDWDPSDNSGFGENAASSASMLKVKKDFTIDWPIASSEEAPVPQVPENADIYDIGMYHEAVSNTVERVNLRELSASLPDLTENVRTSTFVMLLPPQQPTNDGPAMRFTLFTMGGSDRTYVWYAGGSNLTLTRGSISHLILYIPRSENNAILIKSYIEDWIQADSEFAVIPDN